MLLYFQISPANVFGFLSENGTCYSGNVTIGNTSYIESQSYAQLIENLTIDNRPLAEVICENMLNLRVPR